MGFLLWLIVATVSLCLSAEAARNTGDMIEAATRSPQQDKSLLRGLRKSEPIHAVLFAVGGFLGMGVVAGSRRFGALAALVSVIIFLSAYGILLETIQEYFIPGRAFQWVDVCVNELGIILGAGLWGLIALLIRAGSSRYTWHERSLIKREKGKPQR